MDVWFPGCCFNPVDTISKSVFKRVREEFD